MALEPEELEQTRALLRRVDRDTYAGSVLRGGLPVIPVVDTLPDAARTPVGSQVVVQGPPDVFYVLLRNSGGTNAWKQVATG